IYSKNFRERREELRRQEEQGRKEEQGPKEEHGRTQSPAGTPAQEALAGDSASLRAYLAAEFQRLHHRLDEFAARFAQPAPQRAGPIQADRRVFADECVQIARAGYADASVQAGDFRVAGILGRRPMNIPSSGPEWEWYSDCEWLIEWMGSRFIPSLGAA
ncbi:hypothetical protein H0H92_004946, partial [Tricholoma furcatifolium]